MEPIPTSELSDDLRDWTMTDGRTAAFLERWFESTVSDVGESGVLTVSPRTKVQTVVEQMASEHRGAALIVDGEGQLIGIFTERDVVVRVVARGIDPRATPVGEVMTPQVETVDDDAVVAQALRMMVLGDHRHVPVVDVSGGMRGMISMRDLLHYLTDMFPQQVMNAPATRPSYPPSKEGA